MKMNSTFKNDDYVRRYPAGDAVAQLDFLEDIHDIESETKWLRGKIYNTAVKCINCGPLFAGQLLKDHKIYGNDEEAVLSTITDGSAMGYSAGSQFMYSWAPDDEGRQYYLLTQQAFDALAGLAGSDCPAYRRRTNERKESELNYDLTTLPEGKEILVQVSSLVNKITNIHIGWYNVFRKDKLLYGITDIFDEKYHGYEFKGGIYSHSGIYAKWAFPDQAEEILELYEGTIAKKAPLMSFEDAVPVVSFYTSDSGETAATLSAYLEKDNYYRMKIGNVVKVLHKGETSEQTVIDAAGDLFAKFKDLVAAMAALVNININYPIPCMLNAGIAVCGLNKNHLLKAIEEFKDMYGEDPDGVTGNDIFYVLQRALYNMRLDDKVGEAKTEDCEEALLKLLSPTFSWDSYDTSVISVNVKTEE